MYEASQPLFARSVQQGLRLQTVMSSDLGHEQLDKTVTILWTRLMLILDG